jgi:hypothetical protein
VRHPHPGLARESITFSSLHPFYDNSNEKCDYPQRQEGDRSWVYAIITEIDASWNYKHDRDQRK